MNSEDTPESRSESPASRGRGSREVDIVLYGASGFVGVLVAEYLAKAAPEGVRIALAGRSRSKLEAVRTRLGERAQQWPIVLADAEDTAALTTVAESADVVITTVGPYEKYGKSLVRACARAGTDYVDLTGEVLFVRDSADVNHELAHSTGARIVHSCGFDSIPSDLGVHALHERVRADDAGELTDTSLVVTSLRGGLSGGTLDSIRTQIDVMKADKRLRGIVASPYALSPDRSREPDVGKQSDLALVRGDDIHPSLGGWKAPFFMAPYNTRVVRRSNALREHAYGRKFRYREVMNVGSSVLSAVAAGGVTVGVTTLMAGLSLPPTRYVLDKLLPKPGQGPKAETREKGHFTLDVFTRTSTGARYQARVKANGDPGYQATALMLAESALTLVLDRDALPASGGGVLTPATALGDALVTRLRDAGMELSTQRS